MSSLACSGKSTSQIRQNNNFRYGIYTYNHDIRLIYINAFIICNMENRDGGFSFNRKDNDKILLKSYQHLYKEKIFHDILLISTDFIPIKAHKTVLFAGSNFFKTLFNKELDQASNSVLYLNKFFWFKPDFGFYLSWGSECVWG